MIFKKHPGLIEDREAAFSECMQYRYMLHIKWDATKPSKMFIGLNPSTADERQDDPTVRRCKDYCQRWGYGGLLMTNACAFRATDPKVMLAHDEPIGAGNTIAFLKFIHGLHCDDTPPVSAWGNHLCKVKANIEGFNGSRHDYLFELMPKLDYLKMNKDGTPQHPLYLPKVLTPKPYNY